MAVTLVSNFLFQKNLTMTRNATAVWNGSGKEGTGNLSTQSTVLNKTQYSYKSRFEEGVGTNPEELVAAAHAGCFAMKLSFILQEGYPGIAILPESDSCDEDITALPVFGWNA